MNLTWYLIPDLMDWYREMYLIRRKIGYYLRFKIKKKNKCKICNKKAQTHWHHIIPLSKGGAEIKDNLIEVCLLCHCKLHKFKVGLLNSQLRKTIGEDNFERILSKNAKENTPIIKGFFRIIDIRRKEYKMKPLTCYNYEGSLEELMREENSVYLIPDNKRYVILCEKCYEEFELDCIDKGD